MNPQIFREYDIRGIVDTDLTEDVLSNIGLGFGTYMIESGKRKISIGRDIRLSSERFGNALIKGLTESGCDCIDIGMVPTPVLYFSLFHLNVDGGAMITGSHNPPEFNGIKLCSNKTTLFGEEIQKIRKIIEKGIFSKGSGKVIQKEITKNYIEMVKRKIKLEKKLKVVIDSGNGTASFIAPKLIRDIGCEVIELFCVPDGRFPNHHPDPTIPKYLETLINTVKKERADLGIAYDGDADRIGAIDNSGKIIWGDQLLVLFAREILKKGKAPIVFEVKCSQVLYDDILKHGGIPIMWKAGHSLIKQKMHEENAPLGGEMSGHIFFADNYYGYDDAIYASCRLIELLSKTNLNISEILKDLPQMYNTPEIRIGCPDETKFSIVENIKKYFKERYKTIDVDGVRIIFENGWGLVRASNTQPVLVLRFEANSPELLSKIQKIVMDKLAEYPGVSIPE